MASGNIFTYLLYSSNVISGKYLKTDKKNNCFHNILQFFQTATDILKYTSPLSQLSFKTYVTEGLRS